MNSVLRMEVNMVRPTKKYPIDEVIRLVIRITNSQQVKGKRSDADLLFFEGTTDTKWFTGKTLPGGVDTQIQKTGEKRTLSARYILDGVDNQGKKCRLFVENNGIIEDNGECKTVPQITTDSEALSWLETVEMYGELEFSGEDIIIHIFSTGNPCEEKDTRSFSMETRQAVNPYLPSWEYIPDGEPYVFDGRVYIYGSHDMYNGHVFCIGDYVCWSAPVDELWNWRYEGVIYKKTQDPINEEGKMCLYAPDVTVGPDGRYYLYYVLDHASVVSVAVCDTPAGKYEFYGYVHDIEGKRLGEREGDEPQFDPGVLTEGDRTYLFTGFCGPGDKTRTGSMVTILGSDMLTIEENPRLAVPGCEYAEGTSFAEHPFFEASSIRKVGDMYYFIYSSSVMHELCYATSKSPDKDFEYGGVIVSNCDLNIAINKPADLPMAYGANNHGSIVEINGKWYIFYHRHTNNSWYSRQGCAERIQILPDGTIPQVEITSCGLNDGPLEGKGKYPAYLACHLFTDKPEAYVGAPGVPRVMQDGRDGDKEPGYIAEITDSATIGFKYFLCDKVTGIKVTARGYADGVFEVKTAWNGDVLAEIPVQYTNVWEEYSAEVTIPDGKQAIYLTYRGGGTAQLHSFEFCK